MRWGRTQKYNKVQFNFGQERIENWAIEIFFGDNNPPSNPKSSPCPRWQCVKQMRGQNETVDRRLQNLVAAKIFIWHLYGWTRWLECLVESRKREAQKIPTRLLHFSWLELYKKVPRLHGEVANGAKAILSGEVEILRFSSLLFWITKTQNFLNFGDRTLTLKMTFAPFTTSPCSRHFL